MHIGRNLSSLLLLALLTVSCISNQSLLRLARNEPIHNDQINGIYADSAANNPGVLLGHELHILNKIRPPEPYPSEIVSTELNYDGRKLLDVSIHFADGNTDDFQLKAKDKGNYLSVRRKLFLIPIPLFFYWHKERKAILCNNERGNLVMVRGVYELAMVFLLSGGIDYNEKFIYPRIE